MNIKDLQQGSYGVVSAPAVPTAGALNINSLPKDSYSVVPATEAAPAEPGFADRVKSDYFARAEKVKESYDAGRNNEQSPVETLLQHAGQGVGLLTDVAVEAAKSLPKPKGKQVFTPPTSFKDSLLGKGVQAFNTGVEAIANDVSNIPSVQRFALSPTGKRVDRNITALNELAPLLAPEAKVGDLAARTVLEVAGKDALQAGYSAAKKVAAEAATLPAVVQERAVNKLEESYLRWTGSTQSGMKRVAKAGTKTETLNAAGTVGQEPSRVLAEAKIVPKTKGTKFDTFDQAQQFREGVKPLNDANNAALREIETQTPPVLVDDLEKRAFASVNKLKIPEGDRLALIGDVKKEMDLLREKYPDGIKLGDLSTEKQAYSTSVKWDAPRADQIRGDAHYQIRKAAQGAIEDTASAAGHKDVAQLNRVIGDRLEAAKFLEKLHGQTIKGGRLGKYVGGTVLGIAGGATHGLAGALVGYVGGDMIANVLIKASVANPLKRLILKTISETNPAVYERVMKWIEEQAAARGDRLALPPGTNASIRVGPRSAAESKMVVTGGKKAPASYSQAEARAAGRPEYGSLFEYNQSVKASQQAAKQGSDFKPAPGQRRRPPAVQKQFRTENISRYTDPSPTAEAPAKPTERRAASTEGSVTRYTEKQAPVAEVTVDDLVRSRSTDLIQKKLQKIFGTYKELEKLASEETYKKPSRQVEIADAYMADLEHAAVQRDIPEVKRLLAEVRKAQNKGRIIK